MQNLQIIFNQNKIKFIYVQNHGWNQKNHYQQVKVKDKF